MRSAVTVCLMPELKGAPFIYWDGLKDGAARAAELGYDAIELFPPSPEAMDVELIQGVLKGHNLQLSTVGSGGGWALQKLSLTSPDAAVRSRANEFIRGIVAKAASLGASTIVGSMQGRWGDGVSRQEALKWLGEAIAEIGDYAVAQGKPLFYEPLNRYETNLVNTLEDTVAFFEGAGAKSAKILADLFHMNIEEKSVPDAFRAAGKWVGHVHFADSNRRPVGCGHMDFPPIIAALREIGYDGYLSAEVIPWPNSHEAAQLTIQAYRKYAA